MPTHPNPRCAVAAGLSPQHLQEPGASVGTCKAATHVLSAPHAPRCQATSARSPHVGEVDDLEGAVLPEPELVSSGSSGTERQNAQGEAKRVPHVITKSVQRVGVELWGPGRAISFISGRAAWAGGPRTGIQPIRLPIDIVLSDTGHCQARTWPRIAAGMAQQTGTQLTAVVAAALAGHLRMRRRGTCAWRAPALQHPPSTAACSSADGLRTHRRVLH